MPSLISSFPLSWLGGMIGPLCFCAAGVLLIAYELIGMYQEPREGQRGAWYERPLCWIGGSGIAIGLVTLVDMKIASLPDGWPEGLFVLGFFVTSLLSIIYCVIMLIVVLGGSKREALSRKARAERRSSPERAVVLE